MLARFTLAAAAALSLLATAPVFAQAPAGPPAVTAANVTFRGPVAETATSRIFAPVRTSAEDMARYGYVQEEWFVSGRGNVYRYGPGDRLEVAQADLPYVTRLLVVRPRDPRRFSGVVQLSAFHPNFGGETTWSRYGDYVMRRGQAYVIVQAGGDAPSTRASTPEAPVNGPELTRWFNPERYGPLSWPSDGLRWDVFSQVAAAVRAGGPNSPLPGLRVQRVYASGWSFLGSFLRTFVNEGFHDRLRTASGGPVINGYLIGISSNAVTAGYTQLGGGADAVALPVGNPRRQLRGIDVPVIELMSENEAITARDPQTPDRDAYRGGHRLYELGGTSHRDSGYPAVIGTNHEQLLARGHPGARRLEDCAWAETDVPMRDIARGALENLERWATTGQAPPRAARMDTDWTAARARTDDYGNPRGGVRPAQLDVPLARYGAPPDNACGVGGRSYLNVRRVPLSAEQLRARYPGGRAQYLREYRARIDQLVRERWLLPEDGRAHVARAEELSREAFDAR